MEYKDKVISILNSQELTEEQKAKLEEVFPQLKESEDERIRKALIEGFRKYYDDIWCNGVTRKECIAWLEKKGKKESSWTKDDLCNIDRCIAKIEIDIQRWADNGKTMVDGDNELIAWLGDLKERCAPQSKQGMQKPEIKVIVPKFRVGDVVKSKSQPMLEPDTISRIEKDGYRVKDGFIGFAWEFDYELVEQKTAWSKEDDDWLSYCCAAIEMSDYSNIDKRIRMVSFLESLKDRVHPKQEWSEEDEHYLNGLIGVIENSKAGVEVNIRGKAADYCINWLKSLRPQKQWKPSMAQLNALGVVAKGYAPDDVDELKSLYNELKNLKD